MAVFSTVCGVLATVVPVASVPGLEGAALAGGEPPAAGPPVDPVELEAGVGVELEAGAGELEDGAAPEASAAGELDSVAAPVAELRT